MPKRKGLLEKDVTKLIIDYLKHNGWLCYRLQSGLMRGASGGFVRMNANGTPDYICVRGPGDIIFVEMKREVGGVVSREQEMMALQLASQKLKCIVANSLDEFKKKYEESY